jgi:hypothetical protein
MPVTLPAWEIQQLQSLGASGSLSGLPPSILEAIDQAESGGMGGSVNAEGYGGYFGLSQSQVGSSLLRETSPQAFATQAEVAAADFATLLKANNGNVYAAEQQYQTGSPQGSGEGTMVFHELGIPATYEGVYPANVGSILTGTSTGDSGTPSSTTLFSTPIGSVTVPYGLPTRIALILVGVLFLAIGVTELFHESHDPVNTVVLPAAQGARTIKTKSANAARKTHHYVRHAVETVGAMAI